MKRIALAALFALAVPAAASADSWREPRPLPPQAPPAYRVEGRGDLRDVRDLDRLLARYDEAARLRDRAAMSRLEWRLLAAIDGELAEAREALRRCGPVVEHGRPGRVDERRAERARYEVRRLAELRAEFAGLQGRFGWRAVDRKLALGAEVIRVARADLPFQPWSQAATAWNDHR
jgi:hypothetical protein